MRARLWLISQKDLAAALKQFMACLQFILRCRVYYLGLILYWFSVPVVLDNCSEGEG